MSTEKEASLETSYVGNVNIPMPEMTPEIAEATAKLDDALLDLDEPLQNFKVVGDEYLEKGGSQMLLLMKLQTKIGEIFGQ